MVDITNLVMLEHGQPLHAFDADQLAKATQGQAQAPALGLRQAKGQEPFTSLDGEGRQLSGDALVVTYGDQPIALAGVIGGVSPAAHGAICGGLLGPVLAMNRARMTEAARRDAGCAAIAQTLGGSAQDAPETIAAWARACGLPGLRAQGLDPARFNEVAAAAARSSSMAGNPVRLEAADLVACMTAAA